MPVSRFFQDGAAGQPRDYCHDNVWRTSAEGYDASRVPMPTMTRTEKLDLRLTPAAKRLLQSAARSTRRSVSEFVLESALRQAEETLPDRQRFGLDTAQWKAFHAALDAPPQALPRLSRVLDEPSVFDRR